MIISKKTYYDARQNPSILRYFYLLKILLKFIMMERIVFPGRKAV
jgi:hypothetical protein